MPASSSSPGPHEPGPPKRGPRTAAGKARAARNATRHGLRAGRFVLLPHEDPEEFAALAAAARAAYAPADPLERELVEAVAVALWRELRADRLEAEVLADIAPADGSRTAGSDLLEPSHRASLATLLRYRAQTAQGVRRAQDALARHRRLVAAAGSAVRADRTNEFPEASPPAPTTVLEDPADRTNEFPTAPGPARLEPREADRKAANPLDTPLLRALGRDPDLVLPVEGLIPEAWPLAQHKADPQARPHNGQGPYRRVPHLPYGQWLAHQHLLKEMERAAAAPRQGQQAAAAPAATRPPAEPGRAVA